MSLDYMKTLAHNKALAEKERTSDFIGGADYELVERSRAHVHTWGRWKLEKYALVFRGPYKLLGMTPAEDWTMTTTYEIGLERCLTGAAVADWIFQINGKKWATPKVVKDFVSALEEVLNPQAKLCNWGLAGRPSKEMSVGDMHARVDARLRRHCACMGMYANDSLPPACGEPDGSLPRHEYRTRA